MAVEPLDMRAGPERLLARLVQVFGAAQAHHDYLFANGRGTLIKLLVHDSFRRVVRRAAPGPVLQHGARFWLNLQGEYVVRLAAREAKGPSLRASVSLAPPLPDV